MQLKLLEKSMNKIEMGDIKRTVTLSPEVRWEDLRIFPFAPEDFPFVEYRGPLLESSYMMAYRSGTVYTLPNADN
jgi:hypothetical protein